jgi:hypothetical protein
MGRAMVSAGMRQNDTVRRTLMKPVKITEKDAWLRQRMPAVCYRLIGTFAMSEIFQMNEINEKLKELFDRIPRRHTAENVKEIYGILDEYEDLPSCLIFG